MNKQEIKQIIQQKLTKPRYEHTIRVRDTALILAKKFNVPIEKVTIAALLHDYAKDESEQQLKQKLKFYKISDDLLTFNKELWHGPVGAMTARETFGIKDEAIYNAIYYHTTARACMSDVEKVIYIADYIEPARQHPGVDDVRAMSEVNLTEAVYIILQQTMTYLIHLKEKIHPNTVEAYNELSMKLRSGE